MDAFFLIVIIAFIAWVVSENRQTKADYGSGPNITTNTLVLPDTTNLKCNKCGNDDINPYRDLETFTFDIECNKCGEVIWENPKRDERIAQIENMLDL